MEDEVKIPEVEQDTQPIVNPQQTRADRLREASSAPDFSMPEIRPASNFFSESVMSMDSETLKDMMRETGIYASTSKQVSTAIGNALMGMNQLGDEMRISYGNLTNYLTGSSVGDEMAKIAYDSITQRYAEMANREEEIGGIRSNLAQLAGGATSFLQLALEGIATAGVLPLAHIGVQEFGQGTYNDMKAYADEHNGSLKGYEPKGFDIAANTANALLQVGIESWLGVGSPRFLVGASRGLVVEGLSGALQEGVQGALSDLTEAVKGNQDISILLDNAEDYLRDAIIGGVLQGAMGAVTHHQNYARAVDYTSQAIAKARGHEEPTAQDQQQAKAIIDAKERQESSILTKEFKAAFDASTGEGQLQAKIANALKKAAETKELDLDTANETEMAQRIEQIATQETMNAMDFAREQNRAISDIELNDIVYKDGAIWLEGLTPEVGDKAVSYARVLAERQSGLAEVNSKLDAINQEIATLKKDLAEAKAENKQAQVEKLQARIDKQNALAEKNRLQAERLKVQTAKLEKQIAKQEEKAKTPETIEIEKVSAEVKPVEAPKVEEVKPVEIPKPAETPKPIEEPKREVLAKVEPKSVVRTSLKKERAIKKTQTGITRKLDADSKFVKVIDKPSNVDFSDGKEYADSLKRYLLNKVIIKEQDGNLYFKLTGGRYAPTSYVVIEDYVKTDPYEIFSAQVEEGKEIGDHFDKAVQDFYEEKGLWSLVEPVKLRSWEEYMKDSGQVTPQVDEASLEQYDPRKQYNKYDMVRVKTQSGEHIGVWDGERMTLHNSMEDAQDFIKNDTEREEANRQADERRAAAQKEESEKQEKAFREGHGFVEMPYIIQLLKDNDMWEGLSLREKGNFNAIGSVMFSNGRVVNAFGNENSKKGTKVTQNTLDTIQKLRDKANGVLQQGSISGKGDTNRGGYDEQLKRIILGEKSDLSTIQHEFAHYWIQNNFKWARSGLASQDWLRKWRDVEEWLGIEPQDRLLSKSASEKFAKAYERYILEGKVAPELQWAFEGFQKAYQDIYDDLENEYFDLNEELAPEVVDWFNRNKEQSPKRLLDADEKKVEKALTLASGTAVMEDVAGTVVMTEPEANGDQKVYMGVKESEIPAGDNLLVQADKTTASKLQRSAKNILSDKVEVQQLATLDTQATLQNFKDWIARDRAGAWDAMMNPDTRPIYRTYLYKAFAEEALNDVDLAIELANVNMAESVRELGQAIQALDIRNISGFDTLEIIRNIEKSKGTISSEELNKEVESIGLNMVELSQDEIDEVDFDTECKL